MQKIAQILRVLIPLVLASCMHERPSDLRLERIYVVDISGTPIYKPPVGNGMLPPPLRLAIELSTTETFPLGARFVWGFCAGETWPEYLYRATDSGGEADADSSAREEFGRHRYLAVPTIVFKPVAPKPELPSYDIADDSRDICLTTGSGTYADVWRSNQVRVPRSLIEKALREPPHTRLPLSLNQLP